MEVFFSGKLKDNSKLFQREEESRLGGKWQRNVIVSL